MLSTQTFEFQKLYKNFASQLVKGKQLLTDLIPIIDLFKGTVFYVLIGIATAFTAFELAIFLKSKANVKERAASFKKVILASFVDAEKKEIMNEEEGIWKNFFLELDKFRRAEKDQKIINEIKKKTENFFEEAAQVRKRKEILEGFQTYMEHIYLRWKMFFKYTFFLWFLLVITSGIMYFIISLPQSPLVIYLESFGYLYILEYFILLIGFFLFPFWAYYSIKFFQYHQYGDVDDFIWYANQDEAMMQLKNKFDGYTRRRVWIERLLSELPRALTMELPTPISPSIKLIILLQKRLKKSLREK